LLYFFKCINYKLNSSKPSLYLIIHIKFIIDHCWFTYTALYFRIYDHFVSCVIRIRDSEHTCQVFQTEWLVLICKHREQKISKFPHCYFFETEFFELSILLEFDDICLIGGIIFEFVILLGRLLFENGFEWLVGLDVDFLFIDHLLQFGCKCIHCVGTFGLLSSLAQTELLHLCSLSGSNAHLLLHQIGIESVFQGG